MDSLVSGTRVKLISQWVIVATGLELSTADSEKVPQLEVAQLQTARKPRGAQWLHSERLASLVFRRSAHSVRRTLAALLGLRPAVLASFRSLSASPLSVPPSLESYVGRDWKGRPATRTPTKQAPAGASFERASLSR